MEKFGAYGFNKSHAAAYGYLSYVTAYLKANYSGEWMASLMTCVRDDLTKVAKFIRECQSMSIAMLPPDINEAGDAFQATKQGIRFAMTGIKGVGAGVVEAIIQERQRRGPFKSFYEFFKRIDTKKVGKKVIESLVEAGCFDFTGWSRDALSLSVDPIYEAVSKEHKEEALGIMSLFSLLGDSNEVRFSKPPEVRHPTSQQEILRKEKALLGFFLTGHPMDEYKHILQRLSCIPLRRLDQMDHDVVFRSAFIVESVQIRIASKTQKKFAVLTISDGIERQELPIWADLYEEKNHLLQENQLLYAVLQVDKKGEELRLSCRWLDDLTKADESMIDACDRAYDKAKHYVARPGKPASKGPSKEDVKKGQIPMKPLLIKLDANQTRHSHILQLKQLMMRHQGSTPIQIHFHASTQSLAILHIESQKGITISDQFKREVSELSCVLGIE
jgi:DNA polymerase III subunit alpha